MYLYYIYKGKLYEIPAEDYWFSTCNMHINIDKKLDPRVDKLGWFSLSQKEGEVWHDDKLWLSEKNLNKAKRLFKKHKANKIKKLQEKIEKLEKSS